MVLNTKQPKPVLNSWHPLAPIYEWWYYKCAPPRSDPFYLLMNTQTVTSERNTSIQCLGFRMYCQICILSVFFCFVWVRISCNSSGPQPCYVAKARSWTSDLPARTSQELGSQIWTTPTLILPLGEVVMKWCLLALSSWQISSNKQKITGQSIY